MRTYEKPTLTLVSLSTNTTICSCQIDVVGPNKDPIAEDILEDIPNAFAVDNCEFGVDGYCKFGPQGEGFFYNS